LKARICIIGLCGATSGSLERLKSGGLLPPILARIGWGSTRLSIPSSEAAAWISLITGLPPGQHGIFDLYRREPQAGHRLRTVNSRDLICETVWSRLDRHGLRSTLLDYPLTLPPPRIAGHAFPGSWTTARQLRFGCHPSDLPKRLAESGAGQLDEFLMDWPRPAAGTGEIAAWIGRQTLREGKLLQLLRFFLANEPSHFNVVLLRAFGKVASHHANHPELLEPARGYFDAIGRQISELAESHPEMNFLFLSEPPPPGFDLNGWLQDQGEFAWTDQPGAAERKVLDANQLNAQAKLVDWSRTRAWHPLAGSGDIHILRRDADHPAGVADSEYLAYRADLAERLARAPGVRRVWTREEAYAGPCQDEAPDLIVETGEPSGICLASGPALTKEPSPVSWLEIAPLIYCVLGSPLPAAAAIPERLLDPAWLAAHPPRTETAEAAGRPADSPRLDPQTESEVLERLRSLGYVE